MTQTLTVPDVGTVMPDLALRDATGRATTLSAVRQGEAAVVFFLRAASCPVCIRHARSLTELADEGRLGNRSVLLVVPGGPAEAAALASRVPSSRVTTWASGNAHASAGLGSFLSLQHSGTFAVTASGAVVYRRTSVLPTGSFSAKELLAAISR